MGYNLSNTERTMTVSSQWITSPCDYHLFPGQRGNILGWIKFKDNREVEKFLIGWLITEETDW